MLRRTFFQNGLAALALLLAAGRHPAQALSLADVSGAEATAGLKAALGKGADAAIRLLGRPDGFLGNPKVRIGLPGQLDDAARLMRTLGQGKRVDELITAINRAAEAAVPMGRDLLVQAVQSMTVTDAARILTGGETSVTEFFESRTRTPLGERFLPVVDKATAQVGLARKYDRFASRAASLGLLRQEDASLSGHVTARTLDGLYLVIGEEERKIRRDPAGTGSALLKKVFGALR